MAGAITGVNDIYAQLSSHGFSIPHIAYDGAIHRFTRLKHNSGWYVAHLVPTEDGPFPIVVCGDWVTGEKHKITATRTISENDARAVRTFLEKAQENEGKRREEKQDFAAALAVDLWELAEPGRISDYISRKSFDGNHGARVDADGVLLIPMHIGPKLWGLQRIFPDGTKKFLAGQRTKGCYYAIGAVHKDNLTYLCEGFATGISIHLATGQPVLVCFSVSNIIEVAKACQGWKIVIAADNDRFTEGNPGVTAAQKVALSHGCPWVAPQFTAEGKLTDFNDLHMAEGLDEVRRQLTVTNEEPKPVAGKKKRSQAELIQDYTRKIPILLPHFLVTRYEDDKRVILKKTGDIVARADKEGVLSDLLTVILNDNLYPLTPNEAAECVRSWLLTAPPVEKPKPYAFASEECETFHRLPFDLIDTGSATPTFDMILRRTGQMSQTIRYWIGSLFVPESDRSVAFWWFGHGGDGKGSVARVLGKVFGKAHLDTHVPDKDGGERRFWSVDLLGKRLVTLDECNNYSFLSTSLFKRITGGGDLRVEGKNKDGFNFKPECSLLFLSNDKPSFPKNKASLRRILYAESKKAPDAPIYPTAVMDALLWDEAQCFLTRCRDEYLSKYPDHGPILMPDDSAEQLADASEEKWFVLSHRHLKRDADGVVLSEKLRQLQKTEGLPEGEYRHWMAWLQREWEISPYKNNDARGWRGMVLKIGAEKTVDVMNANHPIL